MKRTMVALAVALALSACSVTHMQGKSGKLEAELKQLSVKGCTTMTVADQHITIKTEESK